MSQCILQRRQPILSLSILSKAVKNRIAFVEIDYRTAGVGLIMFWVLLGLASWHLHRQGTIRGTLTYGAFDIDNIASVSYCSKTTLLATESAAKPSHDSETLRDLFRLYKSLLKSILCALAPHVRTDKRVRALGLQSISRTNGWCTS